VPIQSWQPGAVTEPTPEGRPAAERMLRFIDASPSPFHACDEAGRLLADAGFERLDEREAWTPAAGGRYLVRGGTLVAWRVGEGQQPTDPFRIVGAHTDSPNLRVRPQPDRGRAGFRQVGVEVYGGALLNSWLDRDLGVSGRLVLRDGDGTAERLVRIDRPVLRVPQLAIHLDREIRSDGLKLNPQQHLDPVWGLGTASPGAFIAWVAEQADAEPEEVLGWDLMTHDLAPVCFAGPDEDLVSAPRLDNLCSSWAGLEALLAGPEPAGGDPVPVLVLFDHEEVGSTSDRGADSSILPTVLERICTGRGGTRDDLHRSLAASACLSADMAHATHPNYCDRHEPGHWVELNAGPVLKVNQNLRYASDATSAALFELACQQAGVPMQRYAHRGDLPCGSTIGPVTAARLGVPTVDVGAPQLAMHSAREIGGADDPAMYSAALTAFLAPGRT
jgi:aspartyl aminopeptidase